MDDQLRAMIEIIKKEVVEQAAGMRQANKVAPVSGRRVMLPLEGRTLDAVYYETSAANAPLIMGFHGGGFLFGGCALDDQMWDAMKRELNANIISIDYRKTPEFCFPAPIEDAYDSAVYLKKHADEFGFDPDHISMSGASAGGNISVGAAVMAAQKGEISFDYLILNYPEVDNYTDPADKGEGSLDVPFMYATSELYLPEGFTDNPLASPLLASEDLLAKMPTVIMRLAENDNLKREGELFAEKLSKLGVEVHYEVAPGMPHGYFEYGFSTGMGMDYLGDDIKSLMADGSMPMEAQKGLQFFKKYYI